MKPALIIAVALAISVYFAPRCEAQNGPTKGTREAAQKNSPAAPLPVPYQINNQWVYTEAQAAGNQSPHWYESPEWVLVIVGCVTFIVIGWQSFETRRSADAAQKATIAAKDGADAALLNARALITSERPWFVANVECDDKDLGLWKVRIVNKGRTPGHLNVMFSEYTFIDIPDNLPIPPKYESFCYAPDTRFFATGESFTDRERIRGFNPDFFIENERKNQTDILVIYGRVTYSDTFMWGDPNEIIHETRWCYFYQAPGGFVPCGPKEYNGYRDRPKEWKAN